MFLQEFAEFFEFVNGLFLQSYETIGIPHNPFVSDCVNLVT